MSPPAGFSEEEKKKEHPAPPIDLVQGGRADMEFSLDQESWWRGTGWPDMFPEAAVPPAPAEPSAPVRASHRSSSPAPARSRRAPRRSATSEDVRGSGRARGRYGGRPKRSNAPLIVILTLVLVGGVIGVIELQRRFKELGASREDRYLHSQYADQLNLAAAKMKRESARIQRELGRDVFTQAADQTPNR